MDSGDLPLSERLSNIEKAILHLDNCIDDLKVKLAWVGGILVGSGVLAGAVGPEVAQAIASLFGG